MKKKKGYVGSEKSISETEVNEIKKKKAKNKTVYKLNTCTIQHSYLLVRKSDKNSCFPVKDFILL